jgi:hypothetical protein
MKQIVKQKLRHGTTSHVLRRGDKHLGVHSITWCLLNAKVRFDAEVICGDLGGAVVSY